MGTRILVGILLVVGLLQVIGSAGNLPLLENGGYVSAASPLPKVMTVSQGLEHLVDPVKVILYTEAGQIQVKDPKHLPTLLSGPHQRKMVYHHLVSHGPLFEDHALQRAEQFAWCDGPLAKAAGAQQVDSFLIRWEFDGGAKEVTGQCK